MNNLLDLAFQIVSTEEQARIIAERVSDKLNQNIIVETKEKQVARTKTRLLQNVGVPSTIIKEDGAGVLKELLIKSITPDYTLWLFIDDDVIYNNSWEWFYENSEQVGEISAFEDEDSGIYVLHIYDLKFTRALDVRIDGEKQTLTVFYKLEVFDNQ